MFSPYLEVGKTMRPEWSPFRALKYIRWISSIRFYRNDIIYPSIQIKILALPEAIVVYPPKKITWTVKIEIIGKLK